MPRLPKSSNRIHEDEAARTRVDRLADPEDATDVLGEIDTTQPLEQRGDRTPMIAARPDGADHFDQRAAAALKSLARTAEHARFAAAYQADVSHISNLLDLLTHAGDQQSAREVVTADLIGQVRSEVDGWAKDRGVNGGES